jgi:hypothetical protein
MDGDARRRGPRRIPAPEPPSGSRRSKRLRDQARIVGPIPRVLISDSESVNRFSGSAGHSDNDPFFIPGVVPGPPEEEEVEAPPNPAEGMSNPVANVEGDRAAEDDQGPPLLARSSPFRRRGPAGSAQRPRKPGPIDFHQGIRLGRLENRVACLEAEIRRLQGQLDPLREKLRNRRMMLGEEFGLDAYIAGGFSTDED